ncbi:MAG: hypothetical protein AABZ14_06195, partial [Candidatus Margulisiibacteriota bacterium]
EKERLLKEMMRLEQAIEHTQKKLSAPGFSQKAPEAVVAQEKQTLVERQTQLLAIQEKIDGL